MFEHFVVYASMFGIPLLGAGGCLYWGRRLVRQVRSTNLKSSTAVFLFFLMSLAPFAFIVGLIGFGSYLGMKHHIYFLFGENTWGLYLAGIGYSYIALAGNILFALRLFLLRRSKTT